MLPESVPAISSLVRCKPARWLGQPVTWINDSVLEPVFISEFCFRGESRHAYLFGTRYDLADAIVDGMESVTGYFEEYFIVSESEGAWRLHRLMQQTSIAFSERDERNDCVPARQVGPMSAPAPMWKESEAFWPLCDGAPMQFVGQATLDESRFAKEKGATGMTVYVFERGAGDNCFKIVTQDQSAQTVDEHYADEDARAGLA